MLKAGSLPNSFTSRELAYSSIWSGNDSAQLMRMGSYLLQVTGNLEELLPRDGNSFNQRQTFNLALAPHGEQPARNPLLDEGNARRVAGLASGKGTPPPWPCSGKECAPSPPRP